MTRWNENDKLSGENVYLHSPFHNKRLSGLIYSATCYRSACRNFYICRIHKSFSTTCTFIDILWCDAYCTSTHTFLLFYSACQLIHINPVASHLNKKVNSLWTLGSPKKKLPFKLQYVVSLYVIKELAVLYLFWCLSMFLLWSPQRTASASCTTCLIRWWQSFLKSTPEVSENLDKAWLPNRRLSAALPIAAPRSQR